MKLYRTGIVFVFLLVTVLGLSAQSKRTLIRAGHLVDVKAGKVLDQQTIVVVDDKIVAVGPTSTIEAKADDRVVDLKDSTVLPGLMDVHTHLTADTNFDPYHELTTTTSREAINGVANAKVTLLAGFTTVRNVGAGGYSDIDLRDAVNEGLVPGPHIYASGPALGITGGHCDDNLLPYQYHHVSEGVADGISGVQQKVREVIKYGADVIKICATGGVLSKGDDPQASQYTLEEMKAIVAEAHRFGRKVAAHAHGAQGIQWASQAGVDSIEHGSYVDAAAVSIMRKNGTYLVPTLYLEDWILENGKLPAFYEQKMKDVSVVAKANIKKAIQSGVKIALGTDAAVYPHGLNAHELDVYVNQLGMTPMAALQSATVNAADLLGITAKAGSLDAGKWADVIAVDGDPIKDVKLLENVKFVMKAGKIYKQDGHEVVQ